MRTEKYSWFKSSYSAQNGDCLEARHRLDGTIDFRDSKISNSPEITFRQSNWFTFIDAVKSGSGDFAT